MDEFITLKFRGKEISGILLSEDKNYITVKLDSGYNANLNKLEIQEISRKKIDKKEKKIDEKIMNNSNLPKISILHTGGTIASKVDYKTGAVSSKFTAEELLSLYSELNEIANLDAKMIVNLMSEDIRFDHYNLLLEEIEKSIQNGASGIIISHGTDTLHYSSCALWYALKNLNVPVILVGAQRSSDRASSDAYLNLKASIDFILWNNSQTKKFNRVGICMHSKIDCEEFNIIDGINARKMHSSRRDAFKQINYSPFATIKNSKVEVLRKEILTNEVKEKVSFTKYDTKLKIGFFKSHPNLFPEEIKSLSIYDAVIVEGTGLGHLAVSEFDNYTKINLDNLKAVRELIKKTKIIVGVQTIYGRTNMNIYSSGRYLLETGVKGNYMNLTTESLFIRTAYCLSQKEKKFDEIWNENLEGFEIRSVDIDYD